MLYKVKKGHLVQQHDNTACQCPHIGSHVISICLRGYFIHVNYLVFKLLHILTCVFHEPATRRSGDFATRKAVCQVGCVPRVS